jgi:hypothetical protein
MAMGPQHRVLRPHTTARKATPVSRSRAKSAGPQKAPPRGAAATRGVRGRPPATRQTARQVTKHPRTVSRGAASPARKPAKAARAASSTRAPSTVRGVRAKGSPKRV